MGASHIFLGEYEEAVEWCKRASRRPTSHFLPHVHLARALHELGQLEEARAALHDALRKKPDLSVTAAAAMLRPLHTEYREHYLDGLRKLGLPE